MRVQAAGIGQHPDPRVPDRALLASDPRRRFTEGGAVRGHTDHRQPPGTQPLHLLGQQPPARAQFLLAELVGTRRRPADDIRDAEPVIQQLALLRGRQLSRRETGHVEHRPEAVARPGEVMAGRPGHQAGVDPAEQHRQTVRHHVVDDAVTGGLEFLGCHPASAAAQRIEPGV
jgi:hypothetical protein